MISPEQIAENVAAVRSRITSACDRAGRDPADVTLIAVSKTHPPEAIAAAYAAGIRDFGENRVQEAGEKIPAARALGVEATWHLIGNLQRNKVAAALPLFDVIHSVDSLRLAEALNERSTAGARVLLEVNVSGETSKHGVSLEEAPDLAERIGHMRHIALIGLMTVAPIAAEPEDARSIFRRLGGLRDALGLRELSMGMTGDFETAIEEGATFVRVGRAIFGART